MADTDEATGEVIQTLVTVMAMNYGFYLSGITQCTTAITKFAAIVEQEVGQEAADAFVGLGIASVISAGIAAYAWHKVATELFTVTQQAQRIQASTQFIQQWSAASVLAGQSANTFANNIEGLHERIQDLSMQPIQSIEQLFSGGNRPFTMLGLSPLQLQGMGAEQQLDIIADRLAQVHDQARQLNIAKELGLEYMLPYLKNGSAGIAELHRQLQALHLELSEGQTASVNAAVTAWRMLQLSFTGLGNQIAAGLAPLLHILASTLTSVVEVCSWLLANVPLLSYIISDLGVAVAVLIGLALFLAAVFWSWSYVLPVLRMGFILLTGVVWLFNAALLALDAHPVIWILAVIALAILAVLYFTGLLGKLKNALYDTMGFSGGSINANVQHQYIGGDPVMGQILSVSKDQLNTQQQMVDAIKRAAPPHMAYSW